MYKLHAPPPNAAMGNLLHGRKPHIIQNEYEHYCEEGCTIQSIPSVRIQYIPTRGSVIINPSPGMFQEIHTSISWNQHFPGNDERMRNIQLARTLSPSLALSPLVSAPCGQLGCALSMEPICTLRSFFSTLCSRNISATRTVHVSAFVYLCVFTGWCQKVCRCIVYSM